MNRRALFTLACCVAPGAALLAPIAASQPGKPARGARVAVVAYHDSRLLTLCPVFGKDVIESNVWMSGMKAKVTVFYPPTGGQYISLHFDAERHARAALPMPAGSPPGDHSSRPPWSAPGDLDRLARDIGVERRLIDEFRARKTYSVVESPGEADFVFVAESTYIAMSAGTADPPPRRESPASEARRDSAARIFSDTDAEWNRRYNWREDMRKPPAPPAPAPPPPLPTLMGFIGGDRHLNWLQSMLAVVVPAAAYKQHAGAGAALAAASVWSGIATEESGPRANISRTIGAASPEALAGQFHAKGSGLPDYLPVCAATPGTILSINEPAEPSPAQPAQELLSRRPAVEREAGRPRFTSGITLVTVPVTVTGRDGQPVRDLPPSAFRVFEDEVEQKVERLDQGTVPSDVALLIDTSGSMRAVREAVRSSAPALAAALRAADRAMVVSFDRRIRVLSDLTRDREALQRALAGIGPGGGTRLYDGLALVAVDRLNQVQGRKAVILLTDGVDTQSQLTDADGALAAVETSNTPVFVVRYETDDARTYMPPGAFGIRRWLIPPDGPEKAEEARVAADQFLMRLASSSGGRLFAARPDADVSEIVAHIGDELSRQLTLAYDPANDTLDGTYRRIRVSVDCDGCSVRARSGYRAGALR
ncbi:MAG: VWA domain-containing protein [Vicinamibacterales bacterium]